jgi:hypothetical protein
VTLSVGTAYYAWAQPERSPFMTALVVWYLSLLVVETGMTAYLGRRHWARTGVEAS